MNDKLAINDLSDLLEAKVIAIERLVRISQIIPNESDKEQVRELIEKFDALTNKYLL